MAEKNKRWYEKSDSFKTFMKMLEELPLDEQCEFAVDIVLCASTMIDREWENIIKDVGEFDPKDFKRWYDKNPNLHVAIECLRELNDSEKELIAQEFKVKILKHQQKKKEAQKLAKEAKAKKKIKTKNKK